jgi:murein DD-endopeptidase MepM/ murein hydrolase activator NlpD
MVSGVTGGQQLGLTGNSGNSQGAHLHFQIKTPTLRCPQQFLLALHDGSPPPAPSRWPVFCV